MVSRAMAALILVPALMSPTEGGLETEESWRVTSELLGSQFGRTVALGDLNADGFADAVVGAPFLEHDGTRSAGRVYVYYGSAGTPSLSPDWVATGGGDRGTFFGFHLDTGDVNNDGIDDLLVGGSGHTHAFFGSRTGLAAASGWTVTGFAGAVAALGDVNGDGFSDVALGSLGAAGGAGQVSVFMGGPGGPSTTPAWTSLGDNQTPDPNLEQDDGAGFGRSVAGAGDVTGDGFDDLLVGADAFDTPSAREAGKAYLYLGSASGLATSPSWTSTGDDGSHHGFGWSVAGAGDVDGDGFDDVIVGTAFGNRVFVFRGSSAGPSVSPDWRYVDDPGSSVGSAVASAGDVNADGFSDVLVGARFFDATDETQGRAFAFHGSAAGLSESPDWFTSGRDPEGGVVGRSLAGGDVDGDGLSDALIGADEEVFLFKGRAAAPPPPPDDDPPPPPAESPGPNPPTDLRQSDAPGSAPFATSFTDDDPLVAFSGTVTHPLGEAATVQLEVEVKPMNVPFNGAGVLTGNAVSGSAASGPSQTVSSDLANGHYRWRARALDSAGKRSDWVEFPAADPDFTIQIPAPPPDEPAPAEPANLVQSSRSFGSPDLPLNDDDPQVALRGTVPAGTAIQIEIKPHGTAFDGAGLHTGTIVPGGGESEVVATLSDGAYHWRARSLAPDGRASAWVEFPAPDPDFTIAIPPPDDPDVPPPDDGGGDPPPDDGTGGGGEAPVPAGDDDDDDRCGALGIELLAGLVLLRLLKKGR